MEFKVFTLNCWGLAVVSKNRIARIKAIAEVLATSNYDVVCLQEVWVNSDFHLIKDKVAGNLPYSHYFYSGVTGSGVCILSKHPIEDVFFHQWSVNGYIHKLHHGDWFGGKGVGLCRLKVNNYKINVYSAHLHAEYHRDCDEYQAHRVLQAFDTAQFIQLTSGGADLVVLAGDLNTEPGDLAYRILLSTANLTDAYNEADEMSQQIVATNESLTNSYTPKELINKQNPGKRIDYIMYNPSSNLQIELKKYELPLPNRVMNCDFSYSDHEAVSSILILKNQHQINNIIDSELKINVLEEGMIVCSEAINDLRTNRLTYWLFTIILLILLIITLVINPPFGYPIIYHTLKIIITIFMAYTMIMATIWNSIENNAIYAGKLTMEVSFNRLKCKSL